MDRLSRLDQLRRVAVLRRLPLGDLDRLVSRGRPLRFRAGERLIEEGHLGNEVFLIVEGRVAIHRELSRGEPRVIAVRGPGDWVGEMALIEDLPRSASVTAETDVGVLCIPKDAFLEVVTGHSAAAVDLLRAVIARLCESDTAQIEILEKKNQRLVKSNRQLSRENRRLRGELDERFSFENFVGSGRSAERVRRAGHLAARSDLPVLLLGETGTGKELLARAIHGASERRSGAFVPVNCALFTETLLESELFGHTRGAFTGAAQEKQGLVEAAHGGTLFLDELADMPPPVQAALLRFLDFQEFRRLGETEVRRADVRVIAATDADLDEAVRTGRIRRDLYYRINVFTIEVPPLRERPEDIPELVSHCALRTAERLGCPPLEFEPAAIEAFGAHDFPGNVRELQNEVDRLMAVLGPGARVAPRSLSGKIRYGASASPETYGDAVRAFKARLLRETLEACNGNRARAARRLGLHRSNLVRMIRDLEIEVPPAWVERAGGTPERAERGDGEAP
jgi:transcriptional regulator with PAS, ATPase and Fis domain